MDDKQDKERNVKNVGREVYGEAQRSKAQLMDEYHMPAGAAAL